MILFLLVSLIKSLLIRNFFYATHNLWQSSESPMFKCVDSMFSMIYPYQFPHLFYYRTIHLEILKTMRTSKHSFNIIYLIFASIAFFI